MNTTKRAYLILHFCVFLWGFTAILGDLIQLPAITLVWWRVLLTSINLILLRYTWSELVKLPWKYIFRFTGIGVLIALHWVTFYGAIKLANASVALICMAMTAFFTSFIEPLFSKTKLLTVEVILGLLMIPAMWLIVQQTDATMNNGIISGIVSALLVAIFSVLNKINVGVTRPRVISFIELSSATLFLSAILPFFYWYSPESAFLPSTPDMIYLVILAVLCTTVPFLLSLVALKYVSAYVSNLIVNLEPVYGIILAIIFLDDENELNMGFYLGVVAIMVLVFSYPLLRRWHRPV